MKSRILITCFFMSFSSISMENYDAGQITTWWTSLSHITILVSKLTCSWMLYMNAVSLEERLSRREEKRQDLGVLQRSAASLKAGIFVAGADLLLATSLFISSQQKKNQLAAVLGFTSWVPYLLNTLLTGV